MGYARWRGQRNNGNRKYVYSASQKRMVMSNEYKAALKWEGERIAFKEGEEKRAEANRQRTAPTPTGKLQQPVAAPAARRGGFLERLWALLSG